MMPASEDMTQILTAATAGDQVAADKLLPLVYDELRALAARYLQEERPSHTLQTTALVHEAYLKLIDQRRAKWKDRTHFFAVAATAMRRILVNHAKAKKRSKRGGDQEKISLDVAAAIYEERALDLVALDEALEQLAAMDQQQSRIVELRFFGGLTVDEVAEVLGISARTVHREWTTARAWLRGQITQGNEDDT